MADIPIAQLNFTADEINTRLGDVPNKADASALETKQDVLVSGTNIKTVNGQSLLGSGDIEIQGGATEEELAGKQDVLVSGTNIKTVNGNSLLGAGDIEISSPANNFNPAVSTNVVTKPVTGVARATVTCIAYAGWIQCNVDITVNGNISGGIICELDPSWEPNPSVETAFSVAPLRPTDSVIGLKYSIGALWITAKNVQDSMQFVCTSMWPRQPK